MVEVLHIEIDFGYYFSEERCLAARSQRLCATDNCYPTIIANNLMNKCGIGIFIDGEIGCQKGVGAIGNTGLANDNQWVSTPNKTCVYGTTNPLQYSNFYVRATTDPYRIANPTLALAQSDCKYMNAGTYLVVSGSTSLSTPVFINTSTVSTPNSCITFYTYSCSSSTTDIDIAEGNILESGEPAIDDEKLYIQQEELYRKIMQDSSLLQMQELADFKALKELEAMGQLSEVGTYFSFPLNEATRQEVEALNNNISTNLNSEENQQIVNSVLLSSNTLEPENFTETQLDVLRTIAAKCPYTDGNAVYMARVALQLLADDVENTYFNTCEYETEPTNAARAAQSPTTTQTVSALATPDGFAFDYTTQSTDKSTIQLTVTDMLGKKVYTSQVSVGRQHIQVETGSQSSAI